MSRRRRPSLQRPFTPFVGGPLTAGPPLPLPEAVTLRELGLPFSDTELTHIRTAMALYKASRQPQLTWAGWKVIGLALNIGEVRAKQYASGVVHSRGPYGDAVRGFLNATGFAFLNKGVRWALRECINALDEVDPWHEGLADNDRAHLNNPIDLWDRFCEDRRTGKTRSKPLPVTRQRRGYPSVLEEIQALQDSLEAAEQRSEMLEITLDDVLAAVSPETLERLPDELLRKIFARLPRAVQGSLHGRLFPTEGESDDDDEGRA
jgi:hypothetical protein